MICANLAPVCVATFSGIRTKGEKAVTKKQNNGPEGSEVPAQKWLRQIGATNITFVGKEDGEGPPDFLVEYKGKKKIAVEVSLLPDSGAWKRNKEKAFEELLKCWIEDSKKDTDNKQSWHVNCEYDRREALPKKIAKNGRV